MSHVRYNDIEVQAFRGLRDRRLTACGTLNLVVGENNSGKTSVLEAILLLSNPTDLTAWDTAIGVRSLPRAQRWHGALKRLDALSWLFPRVNKELQPIRLTANQNSVTVDCTYESTIGVPPKRSETSARAHVESWIGWRFGDSRGAAATPAIRGAILRVVHQEPGQLSLFDSPFEFVLWEDGVSSSETRRRAQLRAIAAYVSPMDCRDDGLLNDLFSDVRRHQGLSGVIALLQEIEPDIVDLTLLQPEQDQTDSLPPPRRAAVLHVEHRELGMVPLQSLGDGVRRATHMALVASMLDEGGVLLIDELEIGMHVSVLDRVCAWLGKMCRSRGLQLFATSHNIDIVDSLLRAAEGDLVLYRLERDGVVRLDTEALQTVRGELGQEVR